MSVGLVVWPRLRERYSFRQNHQNGGIQYVFSVLTQTAFMDEPASLKGIKMSSAIDGKPTMLGCVALLQCYTIVYFWSLQIRL